MSEAVASTPVEEHFFFYRLLVAPDLQTGNGYYKTLLLRVRDMKPGQPVVAAILDWAYRAHGRPLAYTRNVLVPVSAWDLQPSSQDEYDANNTTSEVNGVKYLSERLDLFLTGAGGGLEILKA